MKSNFRAAAVTLAGFLIFRWTCGFMLPQGLLGFPIRLILFMGFVTAVVSAIVVGMFVEWQKPVQGKILALLLPLALFSLDIFTEFPIYSNAYTTLFFQGPAYRHQMETGQNPARPEGWFAFDDLASSGCDWESIIYDPKNALPTGDIEGVEGLYTVRPLIGNWKIGSFG